MLYCSVFFLSLFFVCSRLPWCWQQQHVIESLDMFPGGYSTLVESSRTDFSLLFRSFCVLQYLILNPLECLVFSLFLRDVGSSSTLLGALICFRGVIRRWLSRPAWIVCFFRTFLYCGIFFGSLPSCCWQQRHVAESYYVFLGGYSTLVVSPRTDCRLIFLSLVYRSISFGFFVHFLVFALFHRDVGSSSTLSGAFMCFRGVLRRWLSRPARILRVFLMFIFVCCCCVLSFAVFSTRYFFVFVCCNSSICCFVGRSTVLI